jgi:hypothetical protein
MTVWGWKKSRDARPRPAPISDETLFLVSYFPPENPIFPILPITNVEEPFLFSDFAFFVLHAGNGGRHGWTKPVQAS